MVHILLDGIIQLKGEVTVQTVTVFPGLRFLNNRISSILIRWSKVYFGLNGLPEIPIFIFYTVFIVFLYFYIYFFYSLNREFSFQLTDPIRRNVYQFRTECVEETNLWLHHLNYATIDLFLKLILF